MFNLSGFHSAFASGHQISEGPRKQGSIMATRRSKLREQRERVASDVGILRNTRIYINGYLESTADLEMKRIVVEAGGEIVQVRFTRSVEMVS